MFHSDRRLVDPVAIRASSKSPRERTMSQGVHRLTSCFCHASRYQLVLRDRVPGSARYPRNIFAVRRSHEETCPSCRACFRRLVVIVPPRIPSDLSLSGGLRCLNLFGLKIIQRQYNDRLCAWQNFVRIATLLFTALHVLHFAVCAFAQPFAKFSSVRRRSASCCATRIETNLLGIRYELRLQFRSRNLTRHDVAAIGGSTLQLRPILLSLLKIATATSSSVSTAVSTRIRAT